MKNRKEDIFSNIGIALGMVVFLFFVSSFSVNFSAVQPDHSYQGTSASEIHSSTLKAITVDVAALPSYQKNWVNCVDRLNVSHFSENYKITVYNRDSYRQIILRQKTCLQIKPLVYYRFYNLLYPKDPSEFLS
jgi:hypothetical protein